MSGVSAGGGEVCAMGREVSNWTGTAPRVDPGRILRVHRYQDPDKVRPQIREAAHRVAGEVTALARPTAAYRRVDISTCRDGTLTLAGGTSFHCPAFDRLLKGCTEIAVFVLTLGPGLDERVVDLMEEFEPLDALFVEAAGWLAIESSTRDLAAHLGVELAHETLAISQRMGPGYSYRRDLRGTNDRVGWPLEEQALLFGLFGGVSLPVELLSSSAMKPKMSRSGLFGIAPAAA